ncbi:unnamed protein product, partial [Aureobasidium vineae]
MASKPPASVRDFPVGPPEVSSYEPSSEVLKRALLSCPSSLIEGCFDCPPRIIASHPQSDLPRVTWIDVVIFALEHPSRFNLSTCSNGRRVYQFYYPQKQVRFEIFEEHLLAIWDIIIPEISSWFKPTTSTTPTPLVQSPPPQRSYGQYIHLEPAALAPAHQRAVYGFQPYVQFAEPFDSRAREAFRSSQPQANSSRPSQAPTHVYVVQSLEADPYGTHEQDLYGIYTGCSTANAAAHAYSNKTSPWGKLTIPEQPEPEHEDLQGGNYCDTEVEYDAGSDEESDSGSDENVSYDGLEDTQGSVRLRHDGGLRFGGCDEEGNINVVWVERRELNPSIN